MTNMVINHLNCNGRDGSNRDCVEGWDQEPIIGHPNQSVADLMAEAGWTYSRLGHRCPGCAEATS